MVTINNLKLPATWSTTLPDDPSFDISADELGDSLQAVGDLDWGGTNFDNVGTINGFIFPSGGGVGIDMKTTFLLREEFIYADPTGDLFNGGKYGVNALITRGGTKTLKNYGVVTLSPETSVAGDAGNINTEDGFFMSALLTAVQFRYKAGIAITDNTDTVVWIYIGDQAVPGILSPTTGTQVIASLDSGYGFVFDPNESPNWQIFSKDSLQVVTKVTTSTPAVQGARIILETFLDEDNQKTEYKINGLDVGTITTNFPDAEGLIIVNGCANIVGGTQQSIDLDFWTVEGPRIAF